MHRQLWISPNGVKDFFSSGHVPFAAVSRNDSLYLYETKRSAKKNFAIAARVFSNNDVLDTDQITSFTGDIIGSFVVNDILHVIGINQSNKTLGVLEIEGNRLVRSHKFFLGEYTAYVLDANGVEFIAENAGTNALKGITPSKIYQRGKKLYLTIDHQYTDYNFDHTPVKNVGIEIKTFDLDSDKVTSTIIPRGKSHFRSWMIDDKVFVVNPTKNMFFTTVYSLASGSVISRDSLSTKIPDFNVFFRYGRRDIITQRARFYAMAKEVKTCTPTVYVSKENEKYVIQYGTYYDQNGFVAPMASPAGLIAAIVGTAIMQARERPGVHRYFDVDYDGQHTFKRREVQGTTLKEKIDYYESANFEFVSFKTYINYKNGVAGIYLKDQKLLVVAYE